MNLMAENTSSTGSNKAELPFLYRRIYQLFLENCDRSGFLDFKTVRYLLGSYFHVRYSEGYPILKELQNFGVLKIVPYRGVRLDMNREQKFDAFTRCIA